mgnify:CR=1 FL=1
MERVSERIVEMRDQSVADGKPSRRRPGVEFVSAPDRFIAKAWQRGTVLATFDVAGTALAALIGLIASVATRELLYLPQPIKVVTAPVLLAVLVVPALTILSGSLRQGHYLRIKPFWAEARELVRMVAFSSALAVGLTFVMKTEVSRIWLVATFLSLLLLAPLSRALAKWFLRWSRHWFAPLIIVGDRSLLGDSEKAITSDLTLGYRTAVRVDATHLSEEAGDIVQTELAATLIDLAALYGRPRLLLAFDHRDILESQQTLVEAVAGHFEHVVVAKQMYGLPALNAEPLSIDKHDTLFFRFSTRGMAWHEAASKRVIDIVGASLALALAAPLLLPLALWVRRDGGRAIYGSERIGQNGRRFKCYKLRSMHRNGDEILREHLEKDAAMRAEWFDAFKLRDDPRITPAGRFLRKTSLDELPQFLNVLRGDMSLVGPRPILPDEVAGYGRSISIYQGVRPGLTGLWQISGRSALTYDDRIKLNKWYVRNWSLWLDVSILARTLPAVIATRGAV